VAEVSNFRYIEDLHLVRYRIGSGGLFYVYRDYTVVFWMDREDVYLTVPAGTATNFASIPRPFRNIISKLGPHIEAAVCHDFLCQEFGDKSRRLYDYRTAADIFLAGMVAANVPKWKRALMYRGVLIGGPKW